MSLPTKLTILRIVLTPVVVALLYFETLYFRLASLSVFVIAALTDWFDGRLARKLGYVSPLGNFLDPLADKILVLSTLFAFAFYGHIAVWMVVVIAARDIIITLLRFYADWKGQPVITSVTAKWKTASQMVAVYVLMLYLIFYPDLLPSWTSLPDYIHLMMQLVTLITILTALQYLFENRHHVRSLMLACLRVFAPGNLAK
jgi:CDP-diacylglycerol--glycerol-3-phosphate 3-phosphatidyltransferase